MTLTHPVLRVLLPVSRPISEPGGVEEEWFSLMSFSVVPRWKWLHVINEGSVGTRWFTRPRMTRGHLRHDSYPKPSVYSWLYRSDQRLFALAACCSPSNSESGGLKVIRVWEGHYLTVSYRALPIIHVAHCCCLFFNFFLFDVEI